MGVPDWWTTRRFGLLLHANVGSVPAWAPVGQYSDWYRAHLGDDVSDVLLQSTPLVETLAYHRDRWAHIERYDDFVPFLTFDRWDPDAWTALARDAGMGYVVAVAKHHDGWCWWDAPGTDRTLVAHGPRRNVVAELAAACERSGLEFGTYYSLLDWGDERYGSCDYVDEVVHPQVIDLVRRYGTRMLWGDGHWGQGESHWRSDELISACRAIDPGIAVNDRWWWSERGVASFEYRVPDAVRLGSWEHRRGLGASFSYNRVEPADHLMSPHAIVSLLTEVVAKGGHLLLSVGPDATGAIPTEHADRLAGAGAWVRDHRDLIDRSQPWRHWGDDDCRYLVLDGVVHAIDVDGRGRFRALRRDDGVVAAVTTVDGDPVAFQQDERGLRVTLPTPDRSRMPIVYRLEAVPAASESIALFGDTAPEHLELAAIIGDAQPGDVVHLGDGTYVGPARVPAGVTVRGLGPDRTTIDGLESPGIVLDDDARLEHCTVTGGGNRIVWLPRTAIVLAGRHATVIGCHVDGHVDVTGGHCKVTSCTASGVISRNADATVISRCQFSGMNWDCGIDLEGGSNQLVESCRFDDLLQGVRCTGTVGTTIRNNTLATRWWGVQLVDTEGASVTGNSFERTMRAVDVDGGTLAEVSGNAVADGDSGCVVQGGASDCLVAGNHWARCRIGLLAWNAGAIRHHANIAVDLTEPDSAHVVGP